MNKLALAFGSAAIALLASCATAPEPAAPAPAPAPVQQAPRPAASAPAPAPVAAPRRCDAAVTFQNEETFPFAKDELTPAAKGRLDRDVLGRLAACAGVEAVVIEGHADRLGGQQYNQKLSERRAEDRLPRPQPARRDLDQGPGPIRAIRAPSPPTPLPWAGEGSLVLAQRKGCAKL